MVRLLGATAILHVKAAATPNVFDRLSSMPDSLDIIFKTH